MVGAVAGCRAHLGDGRGNSWVFVSSDGHRLAGDDWQTMSPTDLVALLLEEKGSLYRQLLLSASQSKDSNEPAPGDVTRLSILVDRARLLPVEDFWWDDGYILSDLASVIGVDFVDDRVELFRKHVLEGLGNFMSVGRRIEVIRRISKASWDV